MARVIIAGICLWITLSTYQIMVCMYYCACFWGLAHFSFRESFIEILKKCYLIFFSTVIALLSYLPIYIQAVKNASSPFCGLPNHPYVSQHAVILDKSIFFEGIKDNILLFMYTAKGYFLGGDVVSICIIIILILGFANVILLKINLYKKIFVILCILFAFFSCASLQMILKEAIFPPRCMTPLCIFLLCLLLFILYNSGKIITYLIIPVYILCNISSGCILTAIGNAQRDQNEFEEQMILQPLYQDLSTILKDEGPFSFFLYGKIPDHYTLRTLQNKYSYIGGMSASLFISMRILSWLPLEYNLKSAVYYKDVDISSLEVVISRLTYDILRFSRNSYVIAVHDGYSPKFVKKFEETRYFGRVAK